MDQKPRRQHLRIWLGRLAWLTGGALFIFAGLWVIPPCVTLRIELVNLETVPADIELFLVGGRNDWQEELVWQGRLDFERTTELALDARQTAGHYRLRGRHAGTNEFWDHRFGYTGSANYGRDTDVVLIGQHTIKFRTRRPERPKCPADDVPCLISEIAARAVPISRCLVKGQEAWWRRPIAR